MDLSGRYSGTAAESCARVPSRTVFTARGASSFEIRQRGFEFELVQTLPGRAGQNTMKGVAAANVLALTDSMNGDFVFTGTSQGGSITIKPDPSVPASWA